MTALPWVLLAFAMLVAIVASAGWFGGAQMLRQAEAQIDLLGGEVEHLRDKIRAMEARTKLFQVDVFQGVRPNGIGRFRLDDFERRRAE